MRMQQKCLLGILVVMGLGAFAQAETYTVKGPNSFYDCFLDQTYHYKYTDLTYFRTREYWASNDYDFRTFIRIDLSSIPQGTDVGSAALNLMVFPSGDNTPTDIKADLWKVSPFTTALTSATSDGTNAWPNGAFDGVDGWEETPADRLLASAPINNSMVGTYMTFSGSGLTDYVQSQINAASDRYLYLELSWKDDSANYLGTWYSSEALESQQPYLTVTSVPEPASLSLLAIGILAGLRRKY